MVLHFHDDKHKVLETITIKSNKNSNRMLKIKNGITLRETSNLRPIKQQIILLVSQHLQKYSCYVSTRQTSLDKPVPRSKYLRNVSPTFSSVHIREMQTSNLRPIKHQIIDLC